VPAGRGAGGRDRGGHRAGRHPGALPEPQPEGGAQRLRDLRHPRRPAEQPRALLAETRSTDGGLSFQIAYEEAYGVNPPTLETDEANNLYLIFPTENSNGTRFLKFAPGNYSSPAVNKTTTAAGSAGKFASFYDRTRGLLCHATQWGYFLVFDKSGNLTKSKRVWTTGSTGSGPSYPHLFVDEGGVIHYAMTTHDSADAIPYETIRYLKSTNGGDNWKKMNGTSVSIPVSCDPDSSNSTQINLEDEDTLNTWLGHMHVKNGKVHFMYNTRGVSPVRQHYMRFNATTGVREIDSYTDWGNQWGNPPIQSAEGDGLFASDPDDPGGPLFAVGRYAESSTRKRLVGLVSHDNGSTWQNRAITPASGSGDISDGLLTNVGGCRALTPDGKVIGTLAADRPNWATVYFYQFQATLPADVIWDGSTDTTWAQPDSTSWSGATFRGGDNAQFLGSGAGTVAVSGTVWPGSVTVDSASNYTFSGGAIGGAGTLSKTGAGTMTLYNSHTYTGATTVNGGTLRIARSYSGAGSASASSGITVNSGGTLRFFDHSYQWTFATPPISLNGGTLYLDSWSNHWTVLSGGAVTVNAASALVMNGQYGGRATSYLDGGLKGSAALAVTSSKARKSLVLRNSNSTYSGALTVNGVASADPALCSGLAIVCNGSHPNMPQADLTVNGTLELGDHADSIGWAAGATGTAGAAFQMDALGGAGVVVANMKTAGSTRTLSVGNNNGTGSFSGVIANGANNTLSLGKNGAGTLTLSGANTYTGPTTVSLGTLLVNTPGSLDSNSNVTVAANATLGGTGAVSGPVAVTGTLAPGASAGTLTTGAVTFQPGSTFAWEIADWTGATPGAHWDLLSAASLTFNNTPANKLNVVISGPAANFTETTKTFAIATAGGAVTGFDPAAIAISAPGFPGAGAWTVQEHDSTIQLVYHADNFAAWAAANAPGQTLDMDHDNDGVQNGIEYFMGESGSGFTALPAPDATRTVKWTKDPSYPGVCGVDYVVQTSTDLATWGDVPESHLAIGATVDYTIPADAPARFARLKVTGP